jgi:DNA-binding NarL/FixJ family response regulator
VAPSILSTRTGAYAVACVTRLLIVDDHGPVRTLIRAVVGALADEIFECSCGEDAVDVVAACLPDLVLMDIEMPGIGGIAATRAIHLRFPHVRIAMLTQHDASDLRESAHAAGACAYLLKENLFDVRRLLIGPADGAPRAL